MAELADYTFTIKYRPGKTHVDADIMSRLPMDVDKYLSSCTEIISLPEIEAIHVGIDAISSGKTNLLSSLSTDGSILYCTF